jgi:hypothetical protein
MARIIIQFELLKPTDDVLAHHGRVVSSGPDAAEAFQRALSAMDASTAVEC